MVVVVLMGVCGCGKTTVGQALAERLKWPFRDADEFHSEANKQKMSSAIPLTDEDRVPWLLSIHEYIKSMDQQNQSVVVTCSALKRRYRDLLRSGNHPTPTNTHQPLSPSLPSSPSSSPASSSSSMVFVVLDGTREVLQSRLACRTGHFMPPNLLTSQLDILERPDSDETSLIVDIDASVCEIVNAIEAWLHTDV